MDDNNKIEEILRGEYKGPGLDAQGCTDWIVQMKRVGGMNKIDLEATYERFVSFIRTVKERESSSPSRRHYGYYKVLGK